MRKLWLVALILMLGLPQALAYAGPPPALAAPATPAASAAESQLRDWIAAAIAPDTGRDVARLPVVTLNAAGDLSVVVALRDQGDLDAFRAAAEDDVFQVLHAAYTGPESPVTTATVVGTYSVTSPRRARELRVLRVVLSSSRARQLDWSTATPQDLFTAADVYRFYPPFGDDQGNPIAPQALSTAAAPVISSPVNIGDRTIFLRCIGSGSPTVLLEAGYGDGGVSWAPVQIATSEFVRVCSYDRAGEERSDPPDHYPRTGAEVVADLHATLAKAEVAPPYLLVGQGYGALFSRLFAATYPGEVAGLLLLDPWPESFNSTLRTMVTAHQWQQYQDLLASEPDTEVIDFPATYTELRNAGPLPNVPLLILSHGAPPTAAGYPSGWPVAEQERTWQALQQAMARLTPQGTQRMVPDSGDMIQLAKPDVVVAAIREMVNGPGG